jgi:hypothetical protein
MKARPDPDQLLQWVVREGVRPSQIGARLGVSRATGYEWLRRYAIRPDGPIVAQDELLTSWRAGPESAERVADETGLPAEAVAERLITAGVIASSRPYVLVGTLADPLLEEQLRQWHVDEGRAAAQIAAMTGTTVRQVRYRLSQYGLTRRRGDPPHATPLSPADAPPADAPPADAPPAEAPPAEAPPAEAPLADRLRNTHEHSRAATATTAETLSMLSETVRRLRATAREARRTVQQTAAHRSEAGAGARPPLS